MKFPGKSRWIKGAATLAFGLIVSFPAWAAGPPKPDALSNSLALTLLFVIIALLLAIALLANVVIGAMQVNMERHREKMKAASATKVVTTLLLLGFSTAAFAQDAPEAVAAAPATFSGLSATTFYLLVSIIALELIVLIILVIQLKMLLAVEKLVVAKAVAPVKVPRWKLWWEKANSFRPATEEEKIDLGHDYDGIRELDNSLPKWWLYGFYACIVFAAVYLWRYHVSHSAPSSEQEYAMAVAKAELEKEAYLKNSANKVDENTVELITDAAALAEGQKLFGANCVACHGASGEGNAVGPNLTDNYWLHKGSVKDVFKTIKYGVPDKGMRSWKDDFSPVQIANLSSYIKSLQGTNPANAKEPQGELYTEESAPVADSLKAPDKKLALN